MLFKSGNNVAILVGYTLFCIFEQLLFPEVQALRKGSDLKERPAKWTYDIRMPNVEATQDNMLLCVGDKVEATDSYYITHFKPLDETHNAHHILLFGCEEPGIDIQNAKDNIWSCSEMSHSNHNGYANGPTCKSKPVILYAWAHMAPELGLPPKTGFKIGLGTSIKYIVMQMHYLHKNEKLDNSGVQITLTNQKLPRQAGVLLLLTGGSIPARSTESMEVACKIDDDVKLHPFAYRVHTHKYGTQVSGYLVRGDVWVTLGDMSPQKEQMFYPIKNNVTILKNDIVAARCSMNNTSPKTIYIGPTDQDEMCNFYLMYYFDVKPSSRNLSPSSQARSGREGQRQPEALVSEKQCWSPGPPIWYWRNVNLDRNQQMYDDDVLRYATNGNTRNNNPYSAQYNFLKDIIIPYADDDDDRHALNDYDGNIPNNIDDQSPRYTNRRTRTSFYR